MAEQNRHTLENALQQLPQYGPPAEQWPQISRQLKERQAERGLYDTLDTLPAYHPPPEVWQGIRRALDEAGDTRGVDAQLLKKTLRELPNYKPPTTAWQRIAQALQNEDGEQDLQGRLQQLPMYDPPATVWQGIEGALPVRRIVPLRTWLARAAAVIALALGTWYLWPTESVRLQATYEYQTETAGLAWDSPTADWSDDEMAIAQAVAQFRNDPLARSSDYYDDLIDEWEELTRAKAEITEIMELYGKDAQLIRQMSEIEQERSGLIRRMVREI